MTTDAPRWLESFTKNDLSRFSNVSPRDLIQDTERVEKGGFKSESLLDSPLFPTMSYRIAHPNVIICGVYNRLDQFARKFFKLINFWNKHHWIRTIEVEIAFSNISKNRAYLTKYNNKLLRVDGDRRFPCSAHIRVYPYICYYANVHYYCLRGKCCVKAT